MPIKQSPIAAIQNAASEAVKVIAQAASDSTAKLASAAEAAARVVTAAAAEQVKIVDVKNAGDHDLLVKVDTQLGLLKISVDKLSDRDDSYVLKEDFKPEGFASKDEFVVWRNIIVSGLLLTIAMGVISRFLAQ